MGTTLISSLGAARHGAGGYQRARYEVAGKQMEPTPFFVAALLRSRLGQDVDEVHFVGTRTSGWDQLVEELAHAEEALYVSLAEGREHDGVTDESLAALSEVLSKHWGRSVRCHALSLRDINDDVAPALAARLLTWLPARSERRVLLDVTHGFRSVPLLLMRALELADALAPGLLGRSRAVYGELLPLGEGEQRGRAVVLDSLAAFGQAAEAIRRFEAHLDGDELADLLEPHHRRLSLAVRALSDCLAAGTLRHLDERARQLRNAVNEARQPQAAAPPWLHGVAEALGGLASRLEQPTLAHTLHAVARERFARGQLGSAILTLYEAYTALACPDPVAQYDELKRRLYELEEGLSRAERERARDLSRLRNQVAHGALLVEDSRYLTTARAVRQAFTEGERFVASLLARELQSS